MSCWGDLDFIPGDPSPRLSCPGRAVIATLTVTSGCGDTERQTPKGVPDTSLPHCVALGPQGDPIGLLVCQRDGDSEWVTSSSWDPTVSLGRRFLPPGTGNVKPRSGSLE